MASLSLPPLRRVLAWAVEQGMAVRGQLSEEQIGALERAFAGTEPWSFEHYTGLRVFAYAMARLNLPDIPAILSFGDMLQALDELRAATRGRHGEHLQRAGLCLHVGGHHACARRKHDQLARARGKQQAALAAGCR